MPTAPIKVRAQNELHRCGQRKLQPGRQHPVQAKQVTGHGQHQRRGQAQPNGYGRKASPRGSVLGQHASVTGARLVAGIAHRAAQTGLDVLGRHNLDAG